MATDEYVIEQLEGVVDTLDFIIKSKKNDKLKNAIQQEIENISQQQDLKLKDPYYDNKLIKLEGRYGLLKLENEKLEVENKKLEKENKELKEKLAKEKIIFFPWDEYGHYNPFKTPDRNYKIWF